MPASANEHGDVNPDNGLAPAAVSDDRLPTPDAPAVIPLDAQPVLVGDSPESTLNDLPAWLSEPDGWDKLTEAAQGIVSLQQAKAAGVARKKLHQQARSGKGQRVQRGVYATFAGELTRTAELWMAARPSGLAGRT